MYVNPEEVFGGTKKLLALIELIYSAVDDVSLWPVVLDQVAEAVKGEETLLFTSFPDPATPNVSCLARMDPSALVPYAEYYAPLNVLSERCDRMFPTGTVRYSHQAVPDREFEATEFYNDYFKPNNMHYSFGLEIPLGDQPPAYLTCMRPKPRGAFEAREGTVYQSLMPHLQRALQLHLQFTRLRSNVEGLEFALDAFDHAVFVLDREGIVILNNRRAEDLVRGGEGINLLKGRLAATRPEENGPLQSQLSAAVFAGMGCGISSGGSLLLSRKSAKPPLRLTVTPLRSNLLGSYGQVAAIVFVSDSATKPLSRAAILHQLYRLTPTEGRIADLLAGGHEVGEVANRLGITLETARFHLKRVLSKTGTHRQTELIRLILSFPGCA
jgi:DNA-binding CsgD family transcriptional regulator/PAS domain-containing protein